MPVALSRPIAMKLRVSCSVVLPAVIVAVPEETVSTPVASARLLPSIKPPFPLILKEPPLTVSVLVPVALLPRPLLRPEPVEVLIARDPPDWMVILAVPCSSR